MLKKLTALFISTVMLLSTFISAIPVGANGENENLLAGLTYYMSISDDNYHSSHKDTNHSRLTDGLKGDAWGHADAIGFLTKEKTETFNMTFEFDDPIAFKEIALGFIYGKAAAVNIPQNITVERKVSVGNNWDTIYSGGANGKDDGDLDTVLTSDEDIYAYALRFTITGNHGWTFMDEIEVFAEQTGAMAFGTLSTAQKAVSPRIDKDVEEKNVSCRKT